MQEESFKQPRAKVTLSLGQIAQLTKLSISRLLLVTRRDETQTAQGRRTAVLDPSYEVAHLLLDSDESCQLCKDLRQLGNSTHIWLGRFPANASSYLLMLGM